MYVEPTVKQELLKDDSYFSFVQTCETGISFVCVIQSLQASLLIRAVPAASRRLRRFVDYACLFRVSFEESAEALSRKEDTVG